MELRSVYIANGVGVFLLMLLQYTARAKLLRRRIEDKIFSFLVGGVMLGCLMEALSYTLDGRLFPGARVLNYAANTYLYSLNVLLPFFVMVYVDLGLFGDPGRILKKYRPHIAVGVLMIALNLVNFFVPLTYFISEQNTYERRPLSYAYYAVILYYLITALVLTRRFEKEYGASTFLRIQMFLVPILVGAGLQFLFYGLSLAWLSAAVGLTGLFMMQQNEAAFIDPLTEIYNRQYLNHVLAAWHSQGASFAGAMLDVDHFKGINDRFGHAEGDRALKTVAAILKKARRDNEWVFRYAGDEFIVLKKTREEDGLAAYLQEVERMAAAHNREGGPYPLSLSSGTSFYTSGSMEDFLKRMDGRMYDMKAVHHGDAQ